MDVALRATLKEHGFKRKSRTNYVCAHSSERVWIFEIEPLRQRLPFIDRSGIFVPDIDNIVKRIAPELDTFETFLREPSQLKASIIQLAQIARGWDNATWQKNPKSRHWLWGRRPPPSMEREIPLTDGGWWDMQHVKGVLDKRRTARDWVARNYQNDDREPWERDWQETAEAVGVELDALWRKYANPWLLKCDDITYLAAWFDRHVHATKPPGQPWGASAVTTATAWYLAGNASRAAEILNEFASEAEASLADSASVHEYARNYELAILAGVRKLIKEFGAG